MDKKYTRKEALHIIYLEGLNHGCRTNRAVMVYINAKISAAAFKDKLDEGIADRRAQLAKKQS